VVLRVSIGNNSHQKELLEIVCVETDKKKSRTENKTELERGRELVIEDCS
jgi:hypothetical protein